MHHSWSWLPPSIILSILSFTVIFLFPHQNELQNEGSFKGRHNRPHLFIFTPTSMSDELLYTETNRVEMLKSMYAAEEVALDWTNTLQKMQLYQELQSGGCQWGTTSRNSRGD